MNGVKSGSEYRSGVLQYSYDILEHGRSCLVCLQEFVFGTLTEWLHIYNIYLYCSLWVLNGLLQSAVWPCVVAVMGNWFGKTGCVCDLSSFSSVCLILT